MSRAHPTFLSLFSGCGGFDLGFKAAGYRCLVALDNDPAAVQAYLRGSGPEAMQFDLSSLDLPPLPSASVDVLLAGPPCQGFSTAGKREPDDPRNKLLIATARMAARIQPKVVVVENVCGLVAGEQRLFFDKLMGILTAAGYRTHSCVCDAIQMGVAQTRRRLVLLAWNTGHDIRVEFPNVHGGNLRDAIGTINGAPNHARKYLADGSDAAKIAQRIGIGKKLCNVRAGDRSIHTWDIPEVFGKTTAFERNVLGALLRLRRQSRRRDFGDADPVTATAIRRVLAGPVDETLRRLEQKGYIRRKNRRFDLCHSFNGKFRRLEWDKPSPTVDTRFGQARYYLHPDEHRGFTLREAARIQGFPDTFLFDGPEASQFRLIGNAVPPPMAQCIAKFIRDAILC